MVAIPERNPAGQGWASGTAQGKRCYSVQNATAEPLLQRLDKVRKNGASGWMARCPAHDDKGPSLSITERDGKVLVHCFGGCRTIDVLNAVGLAWRDIMPPRSWPDSPEERRRASQAHRENAKVAALELAALEANVVLCAARQLARREPLSEGDDARLAQAVERLDASTAILSRKETWRPAYMFAGGRP